MQLYVWGEQLKAPQNELFLTKQELTKTNEENNTLNKQFL